MNVVARYLFLAAMGAVATISVETRAQDFEIESSRRNDRDRDRRDRESLEHNFGPDARYVLPSDGRRQYQGSYFVREKRYYFLPRGDNRQQQAQPQVYEGGEFAHVEDLTVRLETLANDFCLELHHNYSHNRGFRDTYREAYQILEAAQFVHDAMHRNIDRRAIVEKVRGIDGLFHHLEEDVQSWTRHQHRAIGRTDMHAKMELMENTIHHLMYDAGIPHARVHNPEPGPRDGGFERAPGPR